MARQTTVEPVKQFTTIQFKIDKHLWARYSEKCKREGLIKYIAAEKLLNAAIREELKEE